MPQQQLYYYSMAVLSFIQEKYLTRVKSAGSAE